MIRNTLEVRGRLAALSTVGEAYKGKREQVTTINLLGCGGRRQDSLCGNTCLRFYGMLLFLNSQGNIENYTHPL